MKTKEILSKLNLEGKKADVYLACLELKGATAYAIAKKLSLKRPTVYDVLNSLLKEGIASIAFKKGVKYFYPSDPEKILIKIKEKEKDFLEILPVLKNLYNFPSIAPKIRFFEGLDGINEVYKISLETMNGGDELLAYAGQGVLQNNKKYIDEYIKERAKKRITARAIYKNVPEIVDYANKDREQLRQTRLVDEKIFPMNHEMHIYKNNIAFMVYGREMFGAIIESEEIAKAQKAIFELAWLGAGIKKTDK